MSRTAWKPLIDRRAGTAKIPLQNTDDFAVIDVGDVEKVLPYTWHLVQVPRPHEKAYPYVKSTEWNGQQNKNVLLARLILGAGDDEHVLHRDEDPLNNRKANLYLGDKSDVEHARQSRGGTSKYKNVYWDRRENRWKGSVTLSGKKQKKGFAEEEDAARWVDEMMRKYYSPLAPMNFPRPGERSAIFEGDD